MSYAQATIAGTVRDTSGAVLPGVTVEAASPALIEKVRSVTTDGSGQFQVIDLRPGAYTVTFTLPGFNTVRREGVELTGSFTATVNAEMRVGALEETVTVTGEAPTVDTQSATRQTVITAALADAIPSGRQLQNLAVLIPAVTATGGTGGRSQDVGGVLGNVVVTLSVHGSRGNDQRMMFNGLTLGTLGNAGSSSWGVPNMQAYQEVAIDFAAVSAELATGGVRMNVIPKDGGNTFKGTAFFAFANESMTGSNFTDRVKNLGLTAPDSVLKVWDVNPGVGGPIKKDRVWFYTTIREQGSNAQVAGAFANLNANRPDVWTYVPDTSKPGTSESTWRDAQMRMTVQATPRNKIGMIYDYQTYCGCPFGITAQRAPETATRRRAPSQVQPTIDWSSPVTSRLLVDAVASYRNERFQNLPPRDLNPLMIMVTEQSNGLVYRASDSYTNNRYETMYYRFGLNYVTGSHAVKVGFNNGFGNATTETFLGTAPVSYRFNNGVPNQISLRALPTTTYIDLDRDLGLFVQDKWTMNRLTVNLGLRLDHLKLSTPEQSLQPTLLAPNRNVTFPKTDSLDWKDITPKSALTYDVFGDGKTAVKVTLNKYLAAQTVASPVANPAASVVNQTTRSWNDANRDFVPNCDLIALPANGECGAIANSDFGQIRPGTVTGEELRKGWGVRGYNWEFSAGVQREIASRVSIDVSYYRRIFGNLIVTDNTSLAASDFDTFSVTAPIDSRLPDGGGYTIGGLYNVKPAAFSRPAANVLALGKNYGKMTEHWNGIDVSARARLGANTTIQGGVSTGRASIDNCEVTAVLPEMLVNATVFNVANTATQPQDYCKQQQNFLTQVKGMATYTVPKADVILSLAIQSFNGPVRAANYTVTSAQAAQTLGRPLSGNAANVVVNILRPGEQNVERLNQLDLRVGKLLRFRNTRTSINLDV
ncbi:MAG: TonB-dependent receptor [Vicinamibacterales bacterium]